MVGTLRGGGEGKPPLPLSKMIWLADLNDHETQEKLIHKLHVMFSAGQSIRKGHE